MAAVAVPTLASETVFHIGEFGIRNTLIMAWLAVAVLIVFALCARATGYKMVPGRFQMMIELLMEGLFNFFDSILLDRKRTRFFFPLIATFFLYLLVGNWMGILPGVGSITVAGMHDGHMMQLPIFRSMNADINMTLAVSALSVIVTQISGIVVLGLLPYAGKFFIAPWKKPYGVGTFVGILELVGEVAKLVSFTFRLFGNIFAGEVLLVVITFLVPYVIPVPFYGLELFVGVIQALVFSVLSLVFISMSMTGHEEHEHAAVAA